jgi:dipeptidyl aminopeptidase/acylaminoacyl peptidase
VTPPRLAPFGSWTSPLTSAGVASASIGLDQVAVDGDDIYWIEMRPAEGGRSVLVRRAPDGRTADVIAPPWSARTLVHEYGGGAYTVSQGSVYFSHFADQRLYRREGASPPSPLTLPGPLRYADGVIDRRRGRMICVREDHTHPGREAQNTLVSLDLRTEGGGHVLVSGSDFYSSPRLSPDGAHLSWLQWNHPNMPWDGTELWVGDVASDGSLGRLTRVGGGDRESIFQPEWAPDGVLHFVSDRTGWWNLYRWRRGQIEPLCEMAAEFGMPQWVFGLSTYAFESASRILCTYKHNGVSRLARLDTQRGALEPLPLGYSLIRSLRAGASGVVFVGASPTEPPSVVRVEGGSERVEVLRRQSTLTLGPGYLSSPQAVEFPTEHGLTAHAFFYAPHNQDCTAPDGARPPLIVRSHGGPTSAVTDTLDLETQFWTSRGIAVLDVNYGGSTGYGRAYRERLNGQWGVVDVDDCVNGARFLVARGLVDDQRLAIRGGSAGGYTTLCALTFRSAFTTGASYFGISDLETMDRETHKFESRYLHRLVGPYPERRDLYRDRSPIRRIDRLSRPLILLQGMEDKVVPPNQAERMFEAVRAKGLPVAYIAFPGEQHGFRRAENIQRALEAELYFYSRIFGFALADRVDPIPIENL